MKKFKDTIEKQVRHDAIERYVNPQNWKDVHISLKEDNSPIVEILPALAGAAAGFVARQAAKKVIGKAATSLAPAVVGGVTSGVTRAVTAKALDKKKEKKVDEGLYSIKNTKTGQRYSVSKYQDDNKLDKIRKGGGDHKHAAHYKDGKVIEDVEDEGYVGTKKKKESTKKYGYPNQNPKKDKYTGYVEDVEVDEGNELQAKMALDDEGISWTMKKNRITVKKKDKKKAQLAWEKSFKKGGWPSLNIEEVEIDESTAKTFVGVIQQGDRSRKPYITELYIDHPLSSKKNNPHVFMDYVADETDLDLTANNDKDTRKMVDSILKRVLFVEMNADGDGTVGTGPDKNGLKKALSKFKVTEEMKEAFFKVRIPDIAPTFVEAGSASQVKMNLRKILRPDSMKELEVEKVTPTTMKKMYRDMAKGEGETNEKLSSKLNV
jgi:uncharacterized protein (DUF697 family)